MFDTDIHTLKDNLLKNNPIFGSNGFYYKNSLELAQNGVSDHFVNMFYIRPLPKGDRKFTVKHDGNFTTIIGNFRIVLQLSPKVKDPIDAIISQMGEYKVIGFNDDTSQVYKAGTGNNKEIDTFNLYSIDFEMMYETVYSCEAIKFIELC